MTKITSISLKKAVAILLTLALLFSVISINRTVNAATVTVYHETFESGVGKAIQSGGASLTAVNKDYVGTDDKKALYVSNRTNGWDAADFMFNDIGLENGKTYTVTIKGYIDNDVTIPTGAQVVAQAVNPSPEAYDRYMGQVQMTTGAAFTITAEYKADTSTYDRIRIQSNTEGAKVPFYIDDILFTASSTDVVVPPEQPRDPAVPFTTITFEDQTTGGFSGRAGTETLTVTNEENHTDGGAYSLKVEGRTSTWHGPSIRVEKNVDQGSEYIITAWVKLLSPDSSQLQLSTQVGNGSSASYNNIMARTVTKNDGWVKYEGAYRYNNVASEYLTVYVESSSNATASFYIDDISFVKTASESLPIQDLTPIKDVYKDNFLIGNAISAEDLEGIRLDLLKKHNNVATAGNAMKPDALQPTKGNFTFTAADTMISKVHAAGLQMHGHVLVWHSQSPAWLNTTTSAIGVSEPLERDEALENMRTHIKTVVNHFGNKVISWDVVNEAMSDNPSNPADWKASLRQSPWYQAIGTDYIEQAFLAAREVLDSNPSWNIKLYYNDYNEDNQNKAQAIYNMVKELNENYAKTHPGKLLIDGIGMQAHYSVSTNPANVKLSLEKFISLGVEVSITELDIMTGSNNQLSDKLAEAQGYLYAQLFNIFKEHPANIKRVTFWGMDDGTSWRSANNPLLFDKNLQAKPAFYGVIDPDKFMAEHKPTTPESAKQASAKYGTPVIDGTVDSIWSQVTDVMPINQNLAAWQGATGTAKALWDDKNLYVLIQVSDSVLDKQSVNAWEQDSVEVFVDENNGKTSFYQDDDGQYRVNFDNEASFSPTKIAEGFVSASKVSGTNYTIEMKIPFKSVTPVNSQKIGFDAQINDAKDGARLGAATWNDTTGNGYQDTSMYGILTLAGKGSSTGTQTGSNGNSTGSSTGNSTSSTPATDTKVTVNKQSGKLEVVVSSPVTLNSDGSATVSIADSVIDDLLKNISSVEKTDAPPMITIKLKSTTQVDDVTLKLSSDALTKILQANKESSLKIVSGQCEVVFDSKAIESISTAGIGTTEITVSKLNATKVAKLSPDIRKIIGEHPVYEYTVVKGSTKVSDFKNGTVTASIPYTLAKEEDPNAVLVYYIESNNKLNAVRGTYRNGVVKFKTTHFSKFAVGYNKVSFKDVKSTDSYYSVAIYLGAREMVTGTNFEPKHSVTRGEAIVMLLKAFDIKPIENPSNNFSDATGEFSGYYAKAKEIGLTSGVGNNKIGADKQLTNEMMLKLIYNMMKFIGEIQTTATPAKDSEINSYKEFSNWSVDAIIKLTESGVLKGVDYKAFKPKTQTNRAEIAGVLYYLLNK